MAQDGKPRRRDPQREPLPLVQHVRSQWKTAFLTQDADGLVTSACRQEGALPRDPGKFVDDVASPVGDVVPISGRRAQEVQLRTERPPTGSCVTVDQPSAAKDVSSRCAVGRARPVSLPNSVVEAPVGSDAPRARRSAATRATMAGDCS